MSRTDGGARAASGLFYQYLSTIECFLTLVDDGWPPESAVWIEETDSSGSDDPDVVDFEVHHPQYGRVAVHQVKSTADPARRTISVAEALKVLIRLSSSVDCPAYVLTTNARPGRGISELTHLLNQASAQSDMSDKSFMASLHALAAGSEEVPAMLAAADTPEAVARLRRAQVQATGETSSAIRRRIRARIRAWRALHGLALSDHAASLVENTLITDVFQRAAGTREAASPHGEAPKSIRVVTLTNFTDLLATSTHLLAEAVGADETSIGLHHVPSGEGIDRPAQLAAIAERFDNVRSRRVQRCALVGRSGIGKSRLAAMYAHANREAYDRVCWMDSESPAAVLASVVGQRRTLGLNDLDQQNEHDIADSFRASVATFSGRWLLIFDNARRPSEIERWLPHAGAAHVLVTTNNAVDWTTFRPLDVPRMTDEQSIELLLSRLELDVAATGDASAAVNAIVQQFQGWPLALQIVAAHFGSLSALVRGAQIYLTQIADYVLDDDTLDRDGYPRSLQAAINMCLDRLARQANHAGDSAAAAGVDMLAVGSVFASHAIPDALLYGTATVTKNEIRDNDGDPIFVPDQDLPRVDQAIRRMRTESLIDRSENPDTLISRELRTQIDINEIVQRIVRARFDVELLIDRAAAHLGAWLHHYISTSAFAEAVAIQPHSLAVLEHARRWTGSREEIRWCSLLAGNQAILFDVQGRSDESIRWLSFEQEILDSLPTRSTRIVAKTAFQGFQSMHHLGGAWRELLPYVSRTLDALEQLAQDNDPDPDAELARSSLESWIDIALSKARFDGSDTAELVEEKRRLQALSGAFPHSHTDRYEDVLTIVDDHIANSRDAQAIELVDSTLRDLPVEKHLLRLALAAYRIEALAKLARTTELKTRLEEFAEDRSNHPQLRTSIGTKLLDAGNNLCFMWLMGIADEVVPLIDRISRLTVDLLVNNYDRCRHALLTACCASVHGDREGVRSMLRYAESIWPPEVPSNVLTSRLIDFLRSWLQYWIECSDLGRTARFIIGTPAGRRRLIDTATAQQCTLLLLEIPSSDRAQLPPSASYSAQWIDVIPNRDRILDLREADTDYPVARIRIDLDGEIRDTNSNPVHLNLDDFAGLVLTTSESPQHGPYAYFSARP
ncbi:NB-ARC domain-containing protein [Nocardia sp. NPDC004168]|uniref:NB-ARC domain-containing protein n=1 Tax=Nocardia sp. NPDC004168 TaxID=3154452 RepID=UPI0033AC494D